MTAVGDAEGAQGAAVVVCIAELRHGVRRHVPCGGWADVCKQSALGCIRLGDERHSLPAWTPLVKRPSARPRMRIGDNVKMRLR
jgi:hypothetical protein